jgi:hypothetical protein
MRPQHSRRLFLGTAAVTVSLPFLPSALWTRRAGAAGATLPRRFMAWFVPNGFNMPDWTPSVGSTAGTTAWKATTISTPLEPIRNKILILTGLDGQATTMPNRPPGDHGGGTGIFLNMIPVNGHETDKTRVSLDQVLLPALNGTAPPIIPSLQIGLQGDNGLCDRTSCDFSRAISWTGGNPMPNIYDPQQLFDKMFAGYMPGASSTDAAQRLAERTSVLDRVTAQAQALQAKLSTSDKAKLDQYLTSIRALETRLKAISTSSLSCTPPARPAMSPPLNFDRGITPSSIISDHLPTFVDLMALAFQCDITRSITFMLGNGTSNNDYQFVVGSSAPHHGTSHHGGNAAQLAKLTKIDTYEITQIASLLMKLDQAVESDGKTVLDHTTFYMGSDIGDGNTHNHWDQPVLLAGGASGKLKIDGRHINYIPQMTFPRPLVGPQGGPDTGRIHISILQAHGMMVNQFGVVTGGPLAEIMA